MNLKDFIIKKLMLFFTLSTLIAIAVFALGSALDPEASLGYDALLSPIEYAALCVLPTLVTYSRRELTAKELLPRMALEFLLTEAVMLTIAYTSPAIDTSRVEVVALIALSVLIIYVLARLLGHIKSSVEAKSLNADLIRFQKLYDSDRADSQV